MFSDSQEQKPEPSVSDKKMTGESQLPLTPEQVRVGSTAIITHGERQAFWKKFLAWFENTSDWPSNTSKQKNLQDIPDLSQGVESAKVKDLLIKAKNAGLPPAQAFVGSDLSDAKLKGINFLGFNLIGKPKAMQPFDDNINPFTRTNYHHFDKLFSRTWNGRSWNRNLPRGKFAVIGQKFFMHLSSPNFFITK